MKKSLFKKIEIPSGIEVKITGSHVKVKGPEGELERTFDIPNLEFKVEDNHVVIGNKKSTKTEKKIMNTTTAHVKNMIQGVKEKFEYKLKVCYHHFPITVEKKDSEIIIKNFLGEKIPRKSKIIKGAEVKIDKDIIFISSTNREIAGQTAANLEIATKVGKRDRRNFQDGIYILNKAGKEI